MKRPPCLAERIGAAYGAQWRVLYGDDLPIGLADRYGNTFAVAAWEGWATEDDHARHIARCRTLPATRRTDGRRVAVFSSRAAG
jgi:hypothetical protein